MTCLVTGGAGFIGTYVVRNLIKQGEEVVVYDVNIRENSIQQVLTEEELKEVNFVQGDIANALGLLNALRDYDAKKIIHLAYLLIPDSNKNPSLAVKVNCQGFNNILEAARILELERVVWASSVAVFGPPGFYGDEYLPEQAPHHPVSVYGACKSLNEYMATYYFEKFKVNSIGLRFTIVYGPARIRGASAFTMELIEKPALNRSAVVPCGDDTIDWQYVEDAAQVTLMACKVKETKTRIFNTKGDLRSVKDAAQYVQRLLPESDISLKPGIFGINWKYNTKRIEEEIGFKPRYSMERGIRETINTIRAKAQLPPV